MNERVRIGMRIVPTVLLGLVALLSIALAVATIELGYDVPIFMKDAFRFERPWAATLLLGPVLVYLAQAGLFRDRGPRMRTSRGLDLAALPRGGRAWFSTLPIALRVSALSLAVLALMGPQSIHAREDSEVEGIDIVLVLDVSLSMEAADIAPTRFVAMQNVVSDFISRRPNDRMGAVIFGRDAYTLMPLTTDHELLRNVIHEIQLNLINGEGTAIGNALGVGLNRLRRSQARSKILILLTDGDSNAGNLSPDQAAELAATMRVKVHTILMGVSDDAPQQMGVDIFGRPVMQRGTGNGLNPELLRTIAQRTGGQAFAVGDRAALERSFHSILDQLERSRIRDQGRIYGELYPALLLPALGLLALEIVLSALVFRRWP